MADPSNLPALVTGLAFALAGRAGLFNVGAEGQLAAGGFGAAVVGLDVKRLYALTFGIGLACVGAAGLSLG
jgi:ABC-type uncharacterized transport system permease subunit